MSKVREENELDGLRELPCVWREQETLAVSTLPSSWLTERDGSFAPDLLPLAATAASDSLLHLPHSLFVRLVCDNC